MSCGVGCRCILDLALLWLWCRMAAAALIQPLAWEPPYATGVVLKKKKKPISVHFRKFRSHGILFFWSNPLGALPVLGVVGRDDFGTPWTPASLLHTRVSSPCGRKDWKCSHPPAPSTLPQSLPSLLYESLDWALHK